MPKPKPGCFSGILRRMLCTGNVPTHPSSPSSNHIAKPNNFTQQIITKDREEEEEKRHQIEPTLVAKLMGLDSLPPNSKLSLQTTTLDSLSRSRSVNFVDFLSKLDVAEPRQIHTRRHRRARTSVSFHEVQPWTSAFRPIPNEVKESKSTRGKENRNDSEVSKPTKGKENGNDSEISKPKNERRRKVLKKSCERRNGVSGSVLAHERENGDGGLKVKASSREYGKKTTEKFVRGRKNQPLESNQEVRSPVSVLDVTRFSERQSISRPVKNLDSRVKVGPEVAFHMKNDIELSSSVPKQSYGKNKDNKTTQCSYADLAEELLNLTERDLNESYWISNANTMTIDFEGVEELCVEFEGPILDLLLLEITREILHI